jgi:hypothetical protein
MDTYLVAIGEGTERGQEADERALPKQLECCAVGSFFPNGADEMLILSHLPPGTARLVLGGLKMGRVRMNLLVIGEHIERAAGKTSSAGGFVEDFSHVAKGDRKR